MCGRYELHKEIDEIDHFLGVHERHGSYHPNYNVAPMHIMPVAYQENDQKIILQPMHWGFMGWKPKGDKKPFLPINTRDDSLMQKPMWKKPFLTKRCIIPANGFYEWSGTKGNKTPHYIYPSDGDFMAFAGIYSELAPDDADARMSYSIITTSPNKIMKPIHDRMPVILHPSEFSAWLNPDNQDPKFLEDLLKPYPDDGIKTFRVSKAVGNVRNNNPGLIEKADLFG